MNTCPTLKPSGFSLIEVLIAVVVMMTLLAAAIPSYRTFLLNSQIRNAAESIQNGLQRARSEAVTRNVNVQFNLLPVATNDQSSWTVSVPSLAPADPVIDTRRSSDGSKNVIRTVFPAGASTLTFDITGRPTANADGSATITMISLDLDPAVLSAAESQDLNVTIDFGGKIRMCDPHAPTGSPRVC